MKETVKITKSKSTSSQFKKREPFMKKKNISISAINGLILMGWRGEELRAILAWITSLYFPSYHHTTVVAEFMDFFRNLYSTRGPEFTASYFKAARLACTKFISGEAIDPAILPGVGLDKLGIPLALPTLLREHLANSPTPELYRLCLTLLVVSRAILGDQWSFDLSPIQTKPTITEDQVSDFSSFALSYMKERKDTFHKMNFQKLLSEKLNFHWSTKSGPNGPAIVTAYWDFLHLPEELKAQITTCEPRLREVFQVLSMYRSRPQFHKVLLDVFERKKSNHLRKLSVKADKEGKSRIFGIIDYWSQQALYPLHKHVFRILESIESDHTFSQGDGVAALSKMQGPYFSVDLSSATDRFPIALQEKVVSILTTPDYAKAWKQILVDYPFHHRQVKHPIYYAAGQPMGAYSSWGVFSLTHHLLVAYAANRCGLKGFRLYSLLGDDIVIADRQVAAEYMKVLAEFGIPYSPMKTHSSSDTFEFAKRWYKGEEITPFPLQGFLTVLRKWHLAYQFMVDMTHKGYRMPSIDGPGSFESLYKTLYHGKDRFVKYLVQRTYMIHAIPHRGDSPERLAQKVTMLLNAFNSKVELSGGLETIEELVALAGSRALGETIARDSVRLRVAAGVWDKSLSQASGIMRTMADQTWTLVSNFVSWIPVLGALDDKIIAAEERDISIAIAETTHLTGYVRFTVANGDMYSYPKYPVTTLINLIKDLEVCVIPKMHGILPIRKAQAITGAQAMFAILYARSLFECLGLRDYGGPNPTIEDVVKLRSYFEIQEQIDKKASAEVLDLKKFESDTKGEVGTKSAGATPKS